MERSWKSKAVLLTLFCVYFAGVIAGLYWGPDYLSRQYVAVETQNAAKLWQVRVLNLLGNSDEAFENSSLTSKDEAALRNFVLSSDAFRLRLFNEDGVGFWSSDSARQAEISRESFFGEQVAHGQVSQTITTIRVGDIEGFDLDHFGENYSENQERLVSEIYIPVIHRGEIHGVVETFRDITDQVQLNKFRFLTAGLVVSGAITFTILFSYLSGLVFRRRVDALGKEQRRKDAVILERDLQRNREVRLLSQLSEWMQASKSMDELFSIATSILGRLLPQSSGSIYIYSNSRDVLEGACSWNGAQFDREILADDCWGLRRGRTYTYGLDELNFACSHDHFGDENIYFCIPIIAHGDTIGLMHIDMGARESDESKTDEASKLAQTCAEQLSLAIANVRLRDELRHQSIRDPLTGLFNRRHFYDVCRNQITSANRKSETFAIASFDIDHFKLFNDNHGHDAGDIVIRSVAERMMEEFEGNDFAFRIGGEEFTILLDAVGKEDALKRIDAFRKSIEEVSVHYNGKKLPRITVSAGIAQYPSDGNTSQLLMKSADEALYSSKAAGRNQVMLANQHKDDKLFENEDLQSIVASTASK